MNSLAEQWNLRFPERAVGKGHRLVKVNGLSDPAGIAAELRKKQITCHFKAFNCCLLDAGWRIGSTS